MDLQHVTVISPATITPADVGATLATPTTLAANTATATTAAAGSSTDNLGAVTAGLEAGSARVAAEAVVPPRNGSAGYVKVLALGLLGLEKPA